MRRIKIEIEDGEVTAVGAPEGQAAGTGAAGATAPPEVLAAAASIGAHNAGPAPAGPSAPGLPMSPPPARDAATSAFGGSGDMSAGAAPGGVSEPEPFTAEAEGADGGDEAEGAPVDAEEE